MAFKKFISGTVKIPNTYSFLTDLKDYDTFWKAQEGLKEFVFKPNHLSCGKFIYVLQRDGKRLIEHDGTPIRDERFRNITTQVLLTPSIRRPAVMLEETIHSHPEIRKFWGTDQGIGDMRLFILYDEILYGKLRMPAKQSRYYANVTRNAPCIHVSNTGIIEDTYIMDNTLRAHPDVPDRNLIGLEMPFWKQFAEAGTTIAKLFKVPFHSVDLTVDEKGEAVVIESEFTPTLTHITPRGFAEIMKIVQDHHQSTG